MAGPSNETEAEALERRKVEALEAIAKALQAIANTVDDNSISGPQIRIR